MFEKESQDYAMREVAPRHELYADYEKVKMIWQDGAEFGYNKANEWHYVKDKLPRKSDATLCELIPVFVAVKVGYNVSTYGTYWNLRLGKFECLDEVYAWCYTPEPPEFPNGLFEGVKHGDLYKRRPEMYIY